MNKRPNPFFAVSRKSAGALALSALFLAGCSGPAAPETAGTALPHVTQAPLQKPETASQEEDTGDPIVSVSITTANETGVPAGNFSGAVAQASGGSSFRKEAVYDLGNEILFEQSGFTVTAKTLDLSGSSPQLKLLAENHSGADLLLTADDFSINDFEVGGFLYCNVPDGKKANDTLEFYSTSMKEQHIDTPHTLEFTLSLSEGILNTVATSAPITLHVPDASPVADDAPQGQVLLDEAGILVIATGLEHHYSTTGVSIYLENQNDFPVRISASNTSINGYVVDSTLYASLNPGKKEYQSLSFHNNRLNENEIRHIDEIELDLSISSNETYQDLLPEATGVVIHFE